MSSLRAFLTVVAAAIVLSLAVLPASAAMPMSATAQAASDDNVLLAQDKTGTERRKTTRTTKMSKRQQKELDSSLDSGSVPKRYQGSVPKEYHHLIPWSK